MSKGSRRSMKQSAARSTSFTALSVIPRSNAPASDVIVPPSKLATTFRSSTGAKSNLITRLCQLATRPSFNCAGPMDLNVQTVAGTAIAS